MSVAGAAIWAPAAKKTLELPPWPPTLERQHGMEQSHGMEHGVELGMGPIGWNKEWDELMSFFSFTCHMGWNKHGVGGRAQTLEQP